MADVTPNLAMLLRSLRLFYCF